MKTLLQIVTQVCDELGIAFPTSIVGSSDNTARQFLALAQRSGDELYKSTLNAGGWPILRKQFLFNITSVGPYTGNTTSGSTTISGLSSTTGIQVGYVASGNGLLNDTLVTAVGVGSVTVNQAANATVSNSSITFAEELYSYPSDLGFFINQTGWDRNFRWQLLGPLDAQEWQVIKSGISPVGPRMRFRLMAGQIAVNPTSGNSDLIVLEYYSNAWCQSAALAPQSSWQADTDTPILEDELFILDIKWRYLRSKGLEYDEEKSQFDEAHARERGRAGMARSLPLNARASGIRLLNSTQVPDTGFGS